MGTSSDKEQNRDYDPQGFSSGGEAFDDSVHDEVFVERPDHQIHYKTLSWQVREECSDRGSWLYLHSQFVSLLMTAEIVTVGLLSLPSSLAVVGEPSETSYIVSNSSKPHTEAFLMQGSFPESS